jgi:hypothetical protein
MTTKRLPSKKPAKPQVDKLTKREANRLKASALDYLAHVWQDSSIPMQLRVNATKIALPYLDEIIKPGSAAKSSGYVSKKQLAKDNAQTAHKGTEWDGLVN